VRSSNKPVIVNEYMGLMPLARKDIYFQPFEMTALYRVGVWNQSDFIRQLSDKQFEAIILFNDPTFMDEQWTKEMLVAIGKNYHYAGYVAQKLPIFSIIHQHMEIMKTTVRLFSKAVKVIIILVVVLAIWIVIKQLFNSSFWILEFITNPQKVYFW